jgi:hypothetical protein
MRAQIKQMEEEKERLNDKVQKAAAQAAGTQPAQCGASSSGPSLITVLNCRRRGPHLVQSSKAPQFQCFQALACLSGTWVQGL